MLRAFACSMLALLVGCEFILDRALEPGELRGTLVLVDDGGVRTPAARAVVSLENGPLVVRADERGRFVIRNVPVGVYELTALWTPDKGGEPSGVRLRNVELASANDARDLGVITLGGLGAIDGKVLNPTGSNARAVVAGVDESAVQGAKFSFGRLAAGAYDVALVDAAGVRMAEGVTVSARARTSVDIDQGKAAATSGSLTGRVVVARSGSPFGATVRLAPTDIEVEVDESGRWVMTDLKAGVYTLLAVAPGTFTTHRENIIVAGASIAPDLLLVPTELGCALGGEGVGTPGDLDGDGVPDADEPDVCLCHPGHVDADPDGACDRSVEKEDPVVPGGCESNRDCAAHPDGAVCFVGEGRCVACLANTDCASNEECSPEHTCVERVVVECATDDDCDGNPNGDFCLVDEGRCVACLDDGVCSRGVCRPNHTCGPPFECQTNDDCSGRPYRIFCDLASFACVECLKDGDCASGACLDTQVCAPVAECVTNDDCANHANGQVCNGPLGVCVECLQDDQCGSGERCGGNYVCEPEDWDVTFHSGLVVQGTRALATLGESIFVELVDVPSESSYQVAGSGEFTVIETSDQHFELRVEAIGAAWVEVAVTPESGDYPDVRRYPILTVHDPEKAVFFDLANGDDGSRGTPDEPKKDPLAYLSSLTASTSGRHLYLTGGDVDLASVPKLTFDAATQGADRIIITGGYERTGDQWRRDVVTKRTRFLHPQGASESQVLVNGASTDVVFDGLVFDNSEGIVCKGGASLRVLNSQVTARYMSALVTNDCKGLVAGSVLLPGDYSSLIATIEMGSDSASQPSRFRLIHNFILSKAGAGFSRNGPLGGDVRFNVFHRTSGAFATSAAMEFDGNFFGAMAIDNLSQDDKDALFVINTTLLPQAPNVHATCANLLSESALYDTGALSMTPYCQITTPLPPTDDLLDAYALRFDRTGARRLDGERLAGPWVGGSEGALPFEIDAEDAILVAEEQTTIEVSAPRDNVEWRLDNVGMEVEFLTSTTGISSDGRWSFDVRADMVGTAGVRVTATDLLTSESVTKLIRLDVRPDRHLVFVDFNAPAGGDGTENAPYSTWPGLSAGDDVLVAENSTLAGQKLTSGDWLPEGVRVYGGFARDADGRFVRRLPLVETHLQATTNASVVVNAGTTATPDARVVDGVTFAARGNQPALVVGGGPLLLLRTRVTSSYPNARAVLEVLNGTNVAVVGSTIAFRQSAQMSAIDLVRLYGGAPSFLFNDLYRGYAVSGTNTTGAAFRFYDNPAAGIYAGNRHFGESLGIGKKYVFFDFSSAPSFTPIIVEANAVTGLDASTLTSVYPLPGIADWDTIAAPPTGEANLSRADCGSAWPFARAWAHLPSNCRAQAKLPSVYLGIGIDSRGLGLDSDWGGRKVHPSLPTLGATQDYSDLF